MPVTSQETLGGAPRLNYFQILELLELYKIVSIVNGKTTTFQRSLEYNR